MDFALSLRFKSHKKGFLKVFHTFESVNSLKKQFTKLKNYFTEVNFEVNTKKALLDILLQSTTADGKSLSNEDIREEVDTFMFEVTITKY